jgi:hypothetical protein
MKTAGAFLAEMMEAKARGENTAELERQFREQSIKQLGGPQYVSDFEITHHTNPGKLP